MSRKILGKLYYTKYSGNSYKPILTLYQLEMECPLEHIDVLKGENRRISYKLMNPRAQVPFLKLEDLSEIAESNAIAWFFAKDSYLIPSDSLRQSQVLQWLLFEQNSLEPNLSQARFYLKFLPHLIADNSLKIAAWQSNAHIHLTYLDTYLASEMFLVGGTYSLADIVVYGYTHLLDESGLDMGSYPNIKSWLTRVEATPRFISISRAL